MPVVPSNTCTTARFPIHIVSITFLQAYLMLLLPTSRLENLPTSLGAIRKRDRHDLVESWEFDLDSPSVPGL